MTLDEYMRDASGIVYIGCKHGNSFFFVGSREEYATMIDAINNKYYAWVEGRVRATAKNLAYAPEPTAKLVAAVDNAWQRLSEWKPIREREIVEQYEHTFEVPGQALLIEGDISGGYWTREEFLKGMEKEKEDKKK